MRRLLLALLTCSLLAPCVTTTEVTSETTGQVPALFGFHEVIARIWHEAWPARDVALLVRLRPDVDRGVAAIAAADLPGILRERKTAWTKGVADLRRIAATYDTAAAANDGPNLLAAAEQLHAQFELLVRTIRPRVREMEPFHVALYRAWHVELPSADWAALRRSAGALGSAMNALDGAKLSTRQAALAERFEKARAALRASVDTLARAAQGTDDAVLKTALEKTHADYQALDAVFD